MPTTIPTTTAIARASLSPSAGDAYFETDTKNYIIYDGTDWRIFNPDSVASASFSNNYVFDFGGTNEYLTSSPVTPNAIAGTVSAWVKYSGSSPLQIFSWSNVTSSNTNRVMLGTSGGGQMRTLYYNNSSYQGLGSSAINDGNWHHVVFTSNGTTWGMWLDGNQQGVNFSGASSGLKGRWVGHLSSVADVDFSDIGATRRSSSAGASSFSVGKIDEVAVWDYELSSDEITQVYGGGTPSDLANLNPNAWYRMGDDQNDLFGPIENPKWTIVNIGNDPNIDMVSQNMEDTDRVQEAVIVT